MQESDYHRYITAFNARDYETLESFFADNFALENAGFIVKGKPAFREFYKFFHEYCQETVTFKGFYPGTNGFVSNVIISFHGLKDLTTEILQEKKFAGMTPIKKGSTVDLEFFNSIRIKSKRTNSAYKRRCLSSRRIS